MSIRQSTEGMMNALGEPAFIIDYRDEHGRRKQVRTDATSKKEARQIEAALLLKIQRAKDLDVPVPALEGTTFERFTDDTYLPAIKLKVSPKTYERYVNISRHLKAFFGRMTLASIKPLTIDDYFKGRGKEITKQGRAPGAGELRNRRFQLRALMMMAWKKQLITNNPVIASDPIRYEAAPKEALTLDQEQQIMDAAPEWLRDIVTIGIYGGMRRAEICLMRWEHVKDGLIYIPAENSKTGEEREVPITSEMEAVLGRLAKRKLESGSPGWVFWNEALKSPFKPNSVTIAYTRIAKKLDINSTFHSTRVTMVTSARESGGIDDATLMKITGHRTVRMLDHYTKVKGGSNLIGATEGLRRGKDARQTQDEAAEA